MDCVWNNATGFVPRIPIVTCGTTSDTVQCEVHKESGCGSLIYATSNEQSILGVKTAPKASISIHYTEPGKPDMLLTTFVEGRGLTQCITGKGSDSKQMPWVTPRIRVISSSKGCRLVRGMSKQRNKASVYVKEP